MVIIKKLSKFKIKNAALNVELLHSHNTQILPFCYENLERELNQMHGF